MITIMLGHQLHSRAGYVHKPNLALAIPGTPGQGPRHFCPHMRLACQQT